MILEASELDTEEVSGLPVKRELIFDYPLEVVLHIGLVLQYMVDSYSFFLIFDYFWLGLVLVCYLVTGYLRLSVHDKRLIFSIKKSFQIHRNGKLFKLVLEDILRVERFENTKMKGMRLIFRNANLEPLEIYSNF